MKLDGSILFLVGFIFEKPLVFYEIYFDEKYFRRELMSRSLNDL